MIYDMDKRFNTLKHLSDEMGVDVHLDIWDFTHYVLILKLHGFNPLIKVYNSMDKLIRDLASLVNNRYRKVSELSKKEKSRKKKKMMVNSLLNLVSTNKRKKVIKMLLESGVDEVLDRFTFHVRKDEEYF